MNQTHSVRAPEMTSTPSKFRDFDGVQLVRATEIESTPIQWLWRGWIARGKLQILAGHPGGGKTTIALDLAAKITSGAKFPDGTTTQPGTVIFFSSEDSAADTLKPRFVAAGGDPNRLVFVDAVLENGRRRGFDPASDLDALKDAISKVADVVLVVIDPIVSVIAGDSHKNAEVRRALQPLVDLAEDCNCAVLGITHFNKGGNAGPPILRLNGSIAFAGLARVVLVAHREVSESDSERRSLVRAKSNLGIDGGGFAYELIGLDGTASESIVAGVRWGEPLYGSAQSLLEPQRSTDSPLGAAIAFLEEALSSQAVPSKAILAGAKARGISERTLKRAKVKLGVTSFNTSNNEWFHDMPGRPSQDKATHDRQDVVASSQSVGPLWADWNPKPFDISQGDF